MFDGDRHAGVEGLRRAFGNPDDQVLIPINTARFRVIGTDRLRSISVLAETEEDSIPATMAEIQRVLRREHKIRQGAPDDFQIRNQADFLNTLGETTAGVHLPADRNRRGVSSSSAASAS